MVRAFTVCIERVSIWFLLFSRIFYHHNLKRFKAIILECSTFLVHFYTVVFLFSSGNSIRESIVVSTSIYIEKFLIFFEVSFFSAWYLCSILLCFTASPSILWKIYHSQCFLREFCLISYVWVLTVPKYLEYCVQFLLSLGLLNCVFDF